MSKAAKIFYEWFIDDVSQGEPTEGATSFDFNEPAKPEAYKVKCEATCADTEPTKITTETAITVTAAKEYQPNFDGTLVCTVEGLPVKKDDVITIKFAGKYGRTKSNYTLFNGGEKDTHFVIRKGDSYKIGFMPSSYTASMGGVSVAVDEYAIESEKGYTLEVTAKSDFTFTALGGSFKSSVVSDGEAFIGKIESVDIAGELFTLKGTDNTATTLTGSKGTVMTLNSDSGAAANWVDYEPLAADGVAVSGDFDPSVVDVGDDVTLTSKTIPLGKPTAWKIGDKTPTEGVNSAAIEWNGLPFEVTANTAKLITNTITVNEPVPPTPTTATITIDPSTGEAGKIIDINYSCTVDAGLSLVTGYEWVYIVEGGGGIELPLEVAGFVGASGTASLVTLPIAGKYDFKCYVSYTGMTERLESNVFVFEITGASSGDEYTKEFSSEYTTNTDKGKALPKRRRVKK